MQILNTRNLLEVSCPGRILRSFPRRIPHTIRKSPPGRSKSGVWKFFESLFVKFILKSKAAILKILYRMFGLGSFETFEFEIFRYFFPPQICYDFLLLWQLIHCKLETTIMLKTAETNLNLSSASLIFSLVIRLGHHTFSSLLLNWTYTLRFQILQISFATWKIQFPYRNPQRWINSQTIISLRVSEISK